MIIDPCVICGIDVEGKKHSAKRRCRGCDLKWHRDYMNNKYLHAIETGKIYEYRKKAGEFMNKKYKNDPLYRMLSRAKPRAKEMGIEFDLNREDIDIPEVCPVLGTPFEYKTYYTMSLDRIDSTKGYVKGNVQVMSHKANAMKNSATPEELLKFAEWVVATYGEAA